MGSLQGSRGEATRTGTKTSGIGAHVRGWNTGVRVFVDHDSPGVDVVYVYRTGGSNGATADKLVCTWAENEDVQQHD